jgi:hypothetical protein
MIAVSENTLHACLEGPKSSFDAPDTAEVILDMAEVQRQGSCQDYWSSTVPIPFTSPTTYMKDAAPYCMDMSQFPVFTGLRACLRTREQAHKFVAVLKREGLYDVEDPDGPFNDPTWIAISSKMHACIEAPRSVWHTTNSGKRIKASADLHRKGSCQEYWGLATPLPLGKVNTETDNGAYCVDNTELSEYTNKEVFVGLNVCLKGLAETTDFVNALL